MLDAFLKKGATQILASSEHTNNKNEDAITSMVFTPLRFMNAKNALQCLQLILANALTGHIGSRTLKSVSLELWPRGLRSRSISAGKHTRCEPDLLAKIQFNAGPGLVVVGEMKWDSYPSASQLATEIAREKAAVSDISNDVDILAFALVKYVGKGFEKLKCELMSWTDVHRKLDDFLRSGPPNSACRAWALNISEFLTRAELTIFTGIKRDYGPLPKLESGRNLFPPPSP